MNLNPVASGNKTVAGLSGIIIAFAVGYVLKKFNIQDTDGTITTMAIVGVPAVGLSLVGIVHKIVKAGGIKLIVKNAIKKFWG